MSLWTKYNLLCTYCDTLFEVTTRDFKKAPMCVCEYPDELILLGWEDATVKTSQPDVTSITPSNVVKINSNPYN